MRLRQLRPSTRLKLVASALLAVPIAVLLLLAVGETAEGDLSGIQHAIEAVPILLLLIAGWRLPRVTGIVLLGLGTLVLAVWLIFIVTSVSTSQDTPIPVWIGVGLILFVPPLVAGWLFIKAGRVGPGP